MPKYSIIIPVYKTESFLPRCINSFLSSKHQEFELILVDDCSPDNSLAVCRQYEAQDSRIKVLHQEYNQGVSAARNAGVAIAQGDYVLFADSDDFVADNYFQTLDLYAGKYDLVEFGHFDYVTNESENAPEIRKSSMCCNVDDTEENAWYKLFMKSFFACPWNKLFSKRLLNECRFDISCVCYEDFLFNLQYCMHLKTFKVIDTPIYYYQQFSAVNHVSKRKWGERFAISHKVAEKVKQFTAQHPEGHMERYLNCYPYGAFIVELKAAKLQGSDYAQSKNKLLRDPIFYDVISAISPKGKTIGLLKTLIQIKCYFLAGILLRKLLM